MKKNYKTPTTYIVSLLQQNQLLAGTNSPSASYMSDPGIGDNDSESRGSLDDYWDE